MYIVCNYTKINCLSNTYNAQNMVHLISTIRNNKSDGTKRINNNQITLTRNRDIIYNVINHVSTPLQTCYHCKLVYQSNKNYSRKSYHCQLMCK